SVLASTERSRCSIAAAGVGSDADFTSRSAKRSCLPDRPDSRRIARRAAERKSIVVSTLIAFPRWLRVSLRLVTAARPRAYQSLGRRDAHRYSQPNASIRAGCSGGGSRPRAWHSRQSLIWKRALRMRSVPGTPGDANRNTVRRRTVAARRNSSLRASRAEARHFVVEERSRLD